MKHREEIMQILEAFDLTNSYRDAGELAGCSPNTVAHWVARRDAGELTATSVRRPQLIDAFLPKVEEWMEASNGKIRADVAHDKLVALGYTGSERTTRRAVAMAARRGPPGTAGCTGRGCPSRGCGSSGTSATGPWSTGPPPGCSAPGCRGDGSGW